MSTQNAEATTRELVEKVRLAFEANRFEPFIQSLWFPHYKNFVKGARIDFTFPITIITGQNGTNKSSIIKTLYGCCPKKSLGDLWFSSATDTIADRDDGATRFIYSYFNEEKKATAEIRLHHVRKVREDGIVDPDYWESSKPSKPDGMRYNLKDIKQLTGRTRWRKIDKKCTLIDFRSEMSAFDRYFYHVPFKKAKNFPDVRFRIRYRASFLKDTITLGKSNEVKQPTSWKIEYKNIEQASVKIINDILGKDYKSIILLNHNVFGFSGSTVSIGLKDGTSYTEAFAGSGEFAIIMLVVKLEKVEEKELVLIDEPEVSLHPSAQQRLMNFICKITLRKKLQIVISTHSPFIIEDMPKSSIKTLFMNGEFIEILQNCDPDQAFFHIAPSQIDRRNLYFEDRLAAEMVRYVAKIEKGLAYAEQFSYNILPGGADTIKNSFVVAASQTHEARTFYILDGDQRPKSGHIDPAIIPQLDIIALDKAIKDQTGIDKIKFPQNSDDAAALTATKFKYLEFYQDHVQYLPRLTPEEIIIKNSTYSRAIEYRDKADYKLALQEIAFKGLNRQLGEIISGDEIFEFAKNVIMPNIPANNTDFQEIIQILDNILAQRD